jgi:hypothetical protein
MARTKALPALAAAIIALLGLGTALGAQETARRPVSVAVRVTDGGRFVDNLGLGDFELKENGVVQKLDSLFLVDRNSVVRREGAGDFLPDVSRRFYMLFQLFEYHPKISNAIREFFNQTFLPGDSLSIQTPMKSYVLSAAALADKPRDALAKELDEIVRRDIGEGGMAYKSVLRELQILVRRISGQNPMSSFDAGSAQSMENFSLEYILTQYRETLLRLEALRQIDPGKIIGFAESLKSVPGRKVVLFVYQREFNPEISPTVLNNLVDNNQADQNIISDLHELFQVYHRNLSLNVRAVSEAFADAAASFNFIFMDKKPDRFGGLVMRERSEDIFKVFTAAAETSGGIVDSSENPAVGVRDALKAGENYYLLYYTPSGPESGDSFKSLSVSVKGKSYEVTSRKGYSKS